MAPRTEDRLGDITAHAWCMAILSDPSITHIRTRKAMLQHPTRTIPLLTRMLFDDDALSAYIDLFKPGGGQRRAANAETRIPQMLTQDYIPPKPSAEMMKRLIEKEEVVYDLDDPEVPELIILCSLGNGLDGAKNRLHGGFIATLLDMAMGLLVFEFCDGPSATVEMKISFKKAVKTPGVYMARGKPVRQKGRWIETKGWIEDGEGTVYAEAWAAWVVPKELAAAKL
ncbi:4HBT domain containing protein [Pyrenophora tritici-repentis]|uniref:Thioesterase superfamily protein n=2 Tax=Pyrenophora tritici-repentis TaxID=45151 RepID=A0A2W1F3Q6_9PLEO|nr:uncharacterized protein PTRG_10710 [Pyrenophora tritici-repentis Pt-1C-BFP]KAA8621382.1 thioesterase superfamily protein [Pyrenophora tritici-repentis]EDU43760.1 conserved hypothetical protein [Pyrenophora tritici-repentis Pt-1C-BFP]KAF7450616.1 thioesterase superfamily protein [Pyrenophora tritici-repentis]KAF7573234.1 thioesterase superfamily protein [Pyrenophora tritici-repentis]KAG9381167.1 thioesterase superfamily protein [Pyrenophora tritici-repentis]